MGSGPRGGIGEIFIPEMQTGSSIMPGKVNPVIREMVPQVAAQVIGNDVAITVGGMGGHFELNVLIPVMACNLLHRSSLFSQATRLFAETSSTGSRRTASATRGSLRARSRPRLAPRHRL